MTVNTTQYPSAMDGDTFGTHTRLLIEPISAPSLKHTGVNSELLDKVADEKKELPLFYPNGENYRCVIAYVVCYVLNHQE